MSAADDAPDHDAEDHDGDCNDDDGDAPARAIPRHHRNDGLVALRFALVGVAHYTRAVADRARIRLAGSNEREIVTTLGFRGRGWLDSHVPVFLLLSCRAAVAGDPMIRVLLPIWWGRESEDSPRPDQTLGIEGGDRSPRRW